MLVERNTIQPEDNSALYFIVGALLVAVAAFAIYYFSSSRPADTAVSDTTRVESVAPASGTADTTTITNTPSEGAPSTTTTTAPTQQ